MTLEEAKKILEKEGFVPERFLGVLVEDVKTASWEKIEVSEAMRVVAENGYLALMEESKYKERKARLKKEYEENTKAPGSAENRIKEDSGVNPALAEAASQFNEALLDEQAKDLKRLGKEIARLNSIIHKKNLKIDELGKESSRHLEGKMKMFGENFDLEQMLKDKNAVLADVAEELRLSKIREKNLTEVCQKYIKANEELKEKLANKVVDKIDAQALKSAESALAYKEEVIETMYKELTEVKHELSSLKRSFRPESTKAVALYADAYARAENKHLRCTEWRNDGKEVSATYILENGRKSKISLDFTGNEIIFSRTDLDKKNRHNGDGLPAPEEPKHDNSFKDFISKTIDNFNRRAAELGCVGSKDGNGIFDQLVGVDIAEEGGDRSATIIECGKDIDDVFEEIKRLCQE